MSLGSQITYKQLFLRHERIRVPIIQRDYAQGRPAETEVREEFLNALKGALQKPADDPTLPLNLDFIYGSVEGEGGTRFLPLDGQQRLTTLFLLHWYMAWRDEQWDTFTQVFQADECSRFAYSVRQSSTEFFDALVQYRPNKRPEKIPSIVESISDQPWYFRSWRLDPTIQSVLHMLEAIHERFAPSTGLFARLMDETQPAITFQLLDLENFGLSDDLYIKMNARGKPLTAFETFKARYEQELKTKFAGTFFTIGEQSFSAEEYVALRLDTAWADLFWKRRDKKSNIFDSALMNVFRAVALVTRDPESSGYLNDVPVLRSSQPSYTTFHESGWLDERFTLAIIHLLDAWSTKSGGVTTLLPDSQYFREEAFFDQIVSRGANLTSVEIVQFAAYVTFIVKHEEKIDSSAFQNWMRIVRNLSVNTDYNRPDDIRRSIAGLSLLLEHSDDILRHFADSPRPISGFSEQQIEEEKIKAQLILAQSAWRDRIDRAESHGYFQGQIEFLLDFSGILELTNSSGIVVLDTEAHLQLQTRFDDVLLKAEAMFTSNGLRSLADFRWERALLATGDYLLRAGRNWSFLVNSAAEQSSWKRFLRDEGTNSSGSRSVVRNFWERLDGVQELSAQLDMIIHNASGLEPWREALIRTPAAIEYCRRRLMRWGDDNQVYLLQTTQMNGTHAELFTFSLYENVLSDLYQKGRLKPLTLRDYDSVVGTAMEPGIYLSFSYDNSTLWFRTTFSNGSFRTSIWNEYVDSYPLVKAALVVNLGFAEQETRCLKVTSPADMERFVRELADKLAAIPSPEPGDL